MADIPYIARRLREGIAASAIAKECGISRQRVYQLIHAYEMAMPMKQKRQSIRHPARAAFENQRKNAHQRGIGWELTFDQWLSVWEQSGKMAQRGRTKGCYVMARPGDRGPYKIGNVYITTHSENAKTAQSHANRPAPMPHKERTGGDGWTVRYRREYHGYFKSEAAADAKVAEMKAALTT